MYKKIYLKNISKFVGRKERTIKRYLGRLIKEGLIISSGTKPNIYHLSNEI